MTRPDIRRFALLIAGELRDRTTETPRSYTFALRDDKHLRVIDQTIASGRRVLTFEAYRGTAAVYGMYPAVRLDGPADVPWFSSSMSARDEGNALTVLENAIVTQLEGGDFARHDADVQIDVREGMAAAAPYVPRFAPVDYARVLARGPLLVAFVAFVLAWIAFIAGGMWAAAVPSSTAGAVTVVGLVLAQLLAVIALMVAGFAGRGGHSARTMVLAIAGFIWIPLASAAPVGAFLAIIGGVLLTAAAASAAAVRIPAPALAFAVCGLAAAAGGAALIDSAPVAAAIVVGCGMIVAACVAAVVIRLTSRRAAAPSAA